MIRRPRILLDVDGPLTQGFAQTACKILRECGVHDATTSKIDRWDLFKALGATPAAEAYVRERLRLPGVALDFEPNPGAREFVAEISEWADVYAVTSPLDGSPTWAHDRERWLHDLGIQPSRIVSVRDKSVVSGDAMIDDRPETLSAWSIEHSKGLPILWTELHNKQLPWRWVRVDDYQELHAELELFDRMVEVV